MSYYFESFSNLSFFSSSSFSWLHPFHNVFFNNCQIKRYHLISGWGLRKNQSSYSVIETYLRCNSHSRQYSDTFAESFVRPRRKFSNFTNNYRCRSQIVRLLYSVSWLLPCSSSHSVAIKCLPRLVNVFECARADWCKKMRKKEEDQLFLSFTFIPHELLPR